MTCDPLIQPIPAKLVVALPNYLRRIGLCGCRPSALLVNIVLIEITVIRGFGQKKRVRGKRKGHGVTGYSDVDGGDRPRMFWPLQKLSSCISNKGAARTEAAPSYIPTGSHPLIDLIYCQTHF